MIKSFGEFLFEAKSVGNIYHFMDIFSLHDMTENYSNEVPKLNFSADDFFDRKDTFFISTTRKFDFKWNAIRLTLDGNKISENYKIVPVSYFSKKPNEVNQEEDQFEERIITKRKSDVIDLKKYCKRVDICTDPNFDFYGEDEDGEGDNIGSKMDEVETAMNYFRELGIPAAIVEKFKPTK